MRLGLRLQLLLALGALLLLSFVPLFFAVSGLTRATMTGVRETNARALGRAIAGHVMAARENRGDDELAPLLDAQIGAGVSAIGVYDAGGALVARSGQEAAAALLPSETPSGVELSKAIQTDEGPALLIVMPSPEGAGGSVATVLRTDSEAVAATPLVRLVALYTAVVALALLVFAYFSMTRLVVRPVVALSHAARRVADGGRRLEAPSLGARELSDLGASLSLMTDKLRDEETELRAKVDELERARGELERAQERLVRSERLASVGKLAAGLAHEIGNPIAAILGFQELLLQGGFDEAETRDFLERSKRETERVSRILRDLLDFARPGAQRGKEIGEPSGSVVNAVGDVIALLGPQKGFRELSVEKTVDPSLPSVAVAHGQLVQVILNLMLNAADAAPEKGGRVCVRASKKGEKWVRVEVEDNGPGVSAEVQAHLFEPFVTTKEVGEGTGLGLAVCRGLIEAAGGTIAIEEGTLGGALFVVEVPASGEVV